MDVYRIEGMRCEGCVSAIRAAVAAASPRAVIEADLASHELRISGAADPQVARRAVEAAGFALVPIGGGSAAR